MAMIQSSRQLASTGALLTTLALLTVSCAGTDAAPLSERERDCLALAMYWEARGEGTDGMTAVGWTVLNRVQSHHFPSSACAVVFDGGEQPPCQFSFWCDGRSDRPTDLRSWRAARTVAERLLLNPPPDPTHGALYYHSTSIRAPWERVRTARVGRHVFYR